MSAEILLLEIAVNNQNEKSAVICLKLSGNKTCHLFLWNRKKDGLEQKTDQEANN